MRACRVEGTYTGVMNLRLVLPGLMVGLVLLVAVRPLRGERPGVGSAPATAGGVVGRIVNGRAVTVPQVPGQPQPLSEAEIFRLVPDADQAIQVEIRTLVPVAPP